MSWRLLVGRFDQTRDKPRPLGRGVVTIVAGHRDMVAAWVVERVRDMTPVSGGYEAIGFSADDGELIGGVVYTSFYRLADGSGDIQLTAAGRPGWLTKGSLRVIFGYPFEQLGCSRVTAVASKANRRSRDLLERLGFRHEGTIRGVFGRGRDGILYGMLDHECRWIRN